MLDIFLSTALKEVQIGDLVISPQEPNNKWQIITTNTGFLGGLPYFTPKNIESYQIKTTPYFLMTKKMGQQLELIFFITTSSGHIASSDIKELYKVGQLNLPNIRVKLTNDAGKVAQFFGTLTGGLMPSYYGGTDAGYLELAFLTNSDRLFGETESIPLTLGTTQILTNTGTNTIYPRIRIARTGTEALPVQNTTADIRWLIKHNDGIQPNYVYDITLSLSTAYDEFIYYTYADYIVSSKPNSSHAPLTGWGDAPLSMIQFQNTVPYRYGVCIPENATVEITVTSEDFATNPGWTIDLIKEGALIDE